MRHETITAPAGTGLARVAAMPMLVVPASIEPQRTLLEAIDTEARAAVVVMLAELQDGEPDVDVVGLLWARVERYTRYGLNWLADKNRDLVLALQSDPRLAVVGQLYAAAESAVIAAGREGREVADRRVAINTYGALLRAQAAARRVAA